MIKLLTSIAIVPAVLASSYKEYRGFSSYTGHGGKEIDSDWTAPVVNTALECEGRCDDDTSCNCVTFRPSDGKCWKRSDCVPSQFGADSNFNTYVKSSSSSGYILYHGYTSYNGHGGIEIDSDWTAPVGLTVSTCEGRCDYDSSCDCVSFRPTDGKCWKRASCVPTQFGADGNFDTYVRSDGPSPTPTPPTPGPVPVPTGVSIRVAKALGSRGYDQLRVSVISKQGSTEAVSISNGEWDYDAQFQNCWQNDARDFRVSTKLVTVQPGDPHTLNVGGNTLTVSIPKQDQGSVGLFIADPCIYASKWCSYANGYSMKETLQTVLNALAAHNDLDYWMNVGDLFYDQAGYGTSDFFSGLSMTTAGKIHGVTMGNHDYWLSGSPDAASRGDSFGNFHLQWYAQDTMSGKNDPSKPFDFSQDPSKYQVASADNFQFYHMIGNVAFIGFTNQADWQWQSNFFEEACAWVGAQNPALLVLLGHWNKQDMGCASGMDTPDAYNIIQTLSGCSSLGSRVKYFEGHRHCNAIVKENTGFLIGSFGMGGGGCGGFPEGDGAFGLPILDTRGGEAKLYYVQLGKWGKRMSHFDATLTCLQENGLSGCTGIPGVQVWMYESLHMLNSFNVSNLIV